MQIDVITIFPEMFPTVLGASILRRAQEQGLLRIALHNLRDYTHDKRRTVDDRPYGGGPGMVIKPEPLFEAVEAIAGSSGAPQVEPVGRNPERPPRLRLAKPNVRGESKGRATTARRAVGPERSPPNGQ